MGKAGTRRQFLKKAGANAAALAVASLAVGEKRALAAKREYGISLASYSLHRTIGTGDGKVPMLDLPKVSSDEFGIDAVELVNWMLASSDTSYMDTYAKNAALHKVKTLLIMVDREGSIGNSSENGREDAIKRHAKWVDIAAGLGCHSIRMNWAGAPRNVMADADALHAFIERSVAPLRKLCDYGDTKNINVLIENHGGPSSYPDTLGRLMERVDHERFGTLPDFGNFPPRTPNYGGPKSVDVYTGIDKLMKYAKAVSAKCYDFDEATGLETKLDYERLINIVVDKHGYSGYIGIEYEGNRLGEYEGVKACKKLLERLRG